MAGQWDVTSSGREIRDPARQGAVLGGDGGWRRRMGAGL